MLVTMKRRTLQLVEHQPSHSWNSTHHNSILVDWGWSEQRRHRLLRFARDWSIVLVAIGIAGWVIPIVPVAHGFPLPHSPHSRNRILDTAPVEPPPPPPQLQSHRRCTITSNMVVSVGDDTTTTSATNEPPMRLIRGLQEIINDYDVFFIDMWGVLHDGKQPYDHVLETIRQMKGTTNKLLLLLSNSSKRYHHSIQNLNQLGFNVDDFHTVITSGEVTYQMLQSTADDGDDITSAFSTQPLSLLQWEPLRSILRRNSNTTTKNVFILGSGDDDIPYCTRCGWTPTTDIYNAHIIFARGPFTIPIPSVAVDGGAAIDSRYKVIDRRTDGEDAYQQTLQNALLIAADHGIPMIVSNPDKVRPDADRSPMPGQIGDLYTSILMKRQQSCTSSNDPSTFPVPSPPASLMKRVGKPFPDVYDVAMQSISDHVTDKSRICMIGDALETDITGGSKFGIDTLWVLGNGVHSIDIKQTNVLASTATGIGTNSDEDILKRANVVLDAFNENNTGTYAEGTTLSPTFVIPYFQW